MISAQLPNKTIIQNSGFDEWLFCPPRVEFHPSSIFILAVVFGSDQWHYQTIISDQWCLTPSLWLCSCARFVSQNTDCHNLPQMNGGWCDWVYLPSIMITSTFCSDQLHAFLWYISCLSYYRKLLVTINSWPKGCYVIEVSGGWMYWERTISESEYWLINCTYVSQHKLPRTRTNSKFITYGFKDPVTSWCRKDKNKKSVKVAKKKSGCWAEDESFLLLSLSIFLIMSFLYLLTQTDKIV